MIIKPARSSNTVSNRGNDNGFPCLIPDLDGMVFELGRGEERVRCMGSNMDTYISICKIDNQGGFAVFLRKRKQRLCSNLEWWEGEGVGREVQEGRGLCTTMADPC